MDTSRLLAITDKLTDRQTDRQNSNMTWIAIGLGEVRRKDERFTPAVPPWSRQWTSRCRRPRNLFYVDFLLIFSRHDLPSASRRRKMLPCTEEEVEALFYFISNLYLTLYPIRTLSIPFPNFTAVHGVGVAQAKPACKHTIATRKCYQYNTYKTTSREMTCVRDGVCWLRHTVNNRRQERGSVVWCATGLRMFHRSPDSK